MELVWPTFHFGPARSGERTTYGARMPDVSLNSILEWANFIRSSGRDPSVLPP